jgi:hypothetical protein
MSRMRGDGAKAVALLAPAIDLRDLTTGRDATSSVDAIAAKSWPAKLKKRVQDVDHASAGLTRLPCRPTQLGEFEDRKSNF